MVSARKHCPGIRAPTLQLRHLICGANLAIYLKIRLHLKSQIDSGFYLREAFVYEDFTRNISPHEIADESMPPRKKEPFQHACKITG